MICYQTWERARSQWLHAVAECLREQRDLWPIPGQTQWSA